MNMGLDSIAIHLMVQPGVANTLLADPVARDQGLLSRCLVAKPRSTIGTRHITPNVAMSQMSQGPLTEFHQRIEQLLQRPLPLVEGTRNELDPVCLTLSGEAERLLIEFANVVEKEQGAGGKLERITGFASKAPEHAIRLAGVLATYENPDTAEINVSNMLCGVDLAHWYLSEALRLRDAAEISLQTRQADELRKWLVDKWSEPFVNVRAMVNSGPSSLRETKVVRKLIPILEMNGWLVKATAAVEVMGKNAPEAWEVVRT